MKRIGALVKRNNWQDSDALFSASLPVGSDGRHLLKMMASLRVARQSHIHLDRHLNVYALIHSQVPHTVPQARVRALRRFQQQAFSL